MLVGPSLAGLFLTALLDGSAGLRAMLARLLQWRVGGLIIGVVWGAWHIIGNAFIASGPYAGNLSLPVFLAARTLRLLVGGLPAYRVLMVWVYDTGADLLLYDLVSALVWWGIISVLAVATRGAVTQPAREAAPPD